MKVIFLDRDGVINRYPGDKKYVTSLKGFKFLRGSLAAIARLTAAGYRIFVISNQAGVTKGFYSKKALEKITGFMLKEIEKAGGKMPRVLYCLHLPQDDCSCRKPKDGLLRQATEGLKVALDDSYFIGDSLMDVKAGKTFGCKTVLVLSGREKLKNTAQWDVFPDFVARNLFEAAKNILAGKYDRA